MEMKIDDDIIIRVIRGEATQSENEMVLEWIKESEDNLNEFSRQKMVWTLSTAPDDMRGEEDLLNFKKLISARSVFSLKDRKFWYGFASAASAAILVLFLGLLFGIPGLKDGSSAKKNMFADRPGINQRYMYTDKGVKGKVLLPDGSTVWLNSDSKLKYPDVFSDDKREVEVSGEAYFEVQKDAKKPMYVKTGKGFTIKVLGTTFSIRSYENDQESKAILYNGSIELIKDPDKNGEKVVLGLKPNDCATIRDDGATKITQIVTMTDIAWLKGEIVFEDTPMSEVLKILERWYGKKFDVKNNSIYKFKLNATFKSESLVQILDIINLCTSVKYRIEDDKVIFQ